MNSKKQGWIISIIACTVLITISVQVYWNYKNYEQNKQRVENEIQASLDDAIKSYFVALTKPKFYNFRTGLKLNDSTIKNDPLKFKSGSIFLNNRDSLKPDSIFKLSQFIATGKNIPQSISDISMITEETSSDSLKLLNNLKTIYISIQNEEIDFHKLDSLLKENLASKSLAIHYQLFHNQSNSRPQKALPQLKTHAAINKGKNLKINEQINEVVFDFKDGTSLLKNSEQVTFDWKGINSQSPFLKNGEQIQLLFKDSSSEALKRSSLGIFLSLLLSMAIVYSLYYLLATINKQKALAAIKNDLISNITHEFKTPITTVSAALEAIENFNAIDDKAKTKKYVDISTSQLNKLHLMVEKLLETATLDSEHLLLNKENTNMVVLIESILAKSEFSQAKKSLKFLTSLEELQLFIDPFHLENAISNLIDNAIKYGGDHIEIDLKKSSNSAEITVSDNGKSIEKNQVDKIFDKFYRIPKGNTHDVKGFGIGLYYTKTIIEKHGAEIQFVPNSSKTVFKISIPL